MTKRLVGCLVALALVGATVLPARAATISETFDFSTGAYTGALIWEGLLSQAIGFDLDNLNADNPFNASVPLVFELIPFLPLYEAPAIDEDQFSENPGLLGNPGTLDIQIGSIEDPLEAVRVDAITGFSGVFPFITTVNLFTSGVLDLTFETADFSIPVPGSLLDGSGLFPAGFLPIIVSAASVQGEEHSNFWLRSATLSVPEPTGLLLFGSGLVAVGLVARRRLSARR